MDGLTKISISFTLVFFTLAHGNELNNQYVSSLIQNKYEVSINKIIENNLINIRKHLVPYDPLKLDDVKILNNGWLKGGILNKLSLVQPVGESTLIYENKNLCFNLNMGWTDIKYTYEYTYKIIIFEVHGTLHGNVDKLNVNFAVCADLKNYKFVFKHFNFTEIGYFDIQLGGGFGNKILELIGKWLLNRNKEDIIKVIEEKAVELFKKLIDDLNSYIPNSNRQIEFVNLINKKLLRGL